MSAPLLLCDRKPRKPRNMTMRAFTGALDFQAGWLRRLYASGPSWNGKPWHWHLATVTLAVMEECGPSGPLLKGRNNVRYMLHPAGLCWEPRVGQYDVIGYPDGPLGFRSGIEPGPFGLGRYDLHSRRCDLEGMGSDDEYTTKYEIARFCDAWNAPEEF